tara:strand:- start:1092 stop:1730 length:639 start_codon:yes stop_codon:yes gene_type:complete
MSRHKKIAWESWNARSEEIINLNAFLPPEIDTEGSAYSEIEVPPELLSPEMFLQPQKLIFTPLGIYPQDSTLKPSDRWDCWMGYTNFDITTGISTRIELVEGVEALRILSRYSFFVGIGKLFEIKDVRRDIEKDLCVYTEAEIFANEHTEATVNLVKEQIKTKKYWSMLVSPEGEVEYIVSDTMDKIYLEGLSDLLKLKQDIGGIILRGTNG